MEPVAAKMLELSGPGCCRMTCSVNTKCTDNTTSNSSSTDSSSGSSSRPSNILSTRRALIMLLLLLIINPIQGKVVGSCWRRLADGMCGKLIKSEVTQDACCSGTVMRSWTTDLKSHPQLQQQQLDQDNRASLNNNSVLLDNPLCNPCAATCDGVVCGEDRKCIMRRGSPRCVCNPQCHLQNKAPVCGSDGRTYASECHLLKRSCRKKKRLLVSHYGPCQTCSGVRCGGEKQCVMDERLVPQCVRCPTKCSPAPKSRPICGQDGKIYESSCHLKLAQCQQGRAILRSYKGPCKVNATCKDVRCWQGQICLTDPITERPQCTMCGTLESCQASSSKVCGSDGRTYTSWCALHHEACRSGRSIVTMPHQKCVVNESKEKNCKHNRNRQHKEKDSKKEKEPDKYMDSEEDEVNMKNHKYKNVSKGPVAIILSDINTFTNDIDRRKTNSDSNQVGAKSNSNSNSNSNNTSSMKNQKKSEKRQRKKKRKGCKKNRRKNKRERKSKKNSE